MDSPAIARMSDHKTLCILDQVSQIHPDLNIAAINKGANTFRYLSKSDFAACTPVKQAYICQKRRIKILPAHGCSIKSGLHRLSDRREVAVRKFATKTAGNPVYSHWFRLNPNPTSWRKPMIYQEQYARTQGLYESPLFHMRRVLNNSEDEENDPTNYLDLAFLFDDV